MPLGIGVKCQQILSLTRVFVKRPTRLTGLEWLERDMVGFSHHQNAQPGACRHDSRALVNIYPEYVLGSRGDRYDICCTRLNLLLFQVRL